MFFKIQQLPQVCLSKHTIIYSHFTATQVLDTKICNVLRQYLKDGGDPIRDFDNFIGDLPVHVVYYALSYVLKENGIPAAEKEALLERLRQVLPGDTCPIILVPLLQIPTIHKAGFVTVYILET